MGSAQEILLRDWEKLKDEIIVRDVSTKGKHIGLCQSYLSKRRGVSVKESKEFFYQEVHSYVFRLLSNRQIFKAIHVLKNIDESPNHVFFQICKETNDTELRKHILEFMQTSEEKETGYDQKDIELNWTLYERLKANVAIVEEVIANFNEKKISELTPDNIAKLSFDNFLKQSQHWRNQICTVICFETKDETLVDLLDKNCVWEYFLAKNHLQYLHKWAQHVCSGAALIVEDDSSFNVATQERFAKWCIDHKMCELIENYPIGSSDILRTTLAGLQYFTVSEQNNILIKLQRLVYIAVLNEHYRHSINDAELLIKHLAENDMLIVLAENCIDQMLLEEIQNNVSLMPELQFYLTTRKYRPDENHLHQLSSEALGIIKVVDPDYDKKNLAVRILNGIISAKDQWISELMGQDKRADTAQSFPHLYGFLNRLTSSRKLDDHDLTLNKMVKHFHGFDLKNMYDDILDEEAIPHFSNETLSFKYALQFKSTYLHYIMQGRSAYAVYLFFVEQLINYSTITVRQIMAAASVICATALANFKKTELSAHCVAFLEMFNVNTTQLRCYLRLMNVVDAACDIQKPLSVDQLLAKLDVIIVEKLKNNPDAEIPLRDIDAANTISNAHEMKMIDGFLFYFLETDNWLRFILCCQYWDYPVEQIQQICFESYEKTFSIRTEGILRAITNNLSMKKRIESPKLRRNSARKLKQLRNRKEQSNSPLFSMENWKDTVNLVENCRANILPIEKNMFATIIISVCSHEGQQVPMTYTVFKNIIERDSSTLDSTCQNFLSNCVIQEQPVLAIFGAMLAREEVQYCWATWLIVATDFQIVLDLDAFETFEKLGAYLVEECVKHKYTLQSLTQSLAIFFQKSSLQILVEFIARTENNEFSDHTVSLLKNFLVTQYNSDNSEAPFKIENPMEFSIRILLIHLDQNFDSLFHRELVLDALCDSGINDFDIKVDFTILRNICRILKTTNVEINFKEFQVLNSSSQDFGTEYQRLCDELLALKHFEKALEIAILVNLDKSPIVYAHWIDRLQNDSAYDFDLCELELITYELNPELLVSFYMCLVGEATTPILKYRYFKNALNSIKKYALYPSDEFDRDRMEHDMTICYLSASDDHTWTDSDIYHSEFYENAANKNDKILCNTFMELKEMAGIDKLTIWGQKLQKQETIVKLEQLITQLIDQGDIVQAFRLQAIFDQKPIDLHFLVFSMTLAEGLSTVYDLSSEERTIISEGVRSTSVNFNRRTLNSLKTSQTSTSITMPKVQANNSDTSGNLEFEEIPSREKQDTLKTIEGLAMHLKHGIQIAKRIISVYRAAMFLDRQYNNLLKERNVQSLLSSAANEDCLNKLLVFSDIMTSWQLHDAEIAEFMATQIAATIVRSHFYLLHQNPTFGQYILWGYDLNKEFHLFFDLCPHTTLLGNYLIEYIDCLEIFQCAQDDKNEAQCFRRQKINEMLDGQVLSNRKKNAISVALLVKAHKCFEKSCAIEGIASVLHRAKSINATLATHKSWNLIVQMVAGIGSYREMYFCFDTLMKNNQFELLLGKFDEIQRNSLKTSINSYLQDQWPRDEELFRLAAIHFQMYKELAQLNETEGNRKIQAIVAENMSPAKDLTATSFPANDDNQLFFECSPAIVDKLKSAMECYVQASESFILDGKLEMAEKNATKAELIALQIHLANKSAVHSGACVRVLGIQNVDIIKYWVGKLSVPHALILARAYLFEINWIEPLYKYVILQGDEQYLKDFTENVKITPQLIENLVKIFQSEKHITDKMEYWISYFIEHEPSVTKRYKWASLLGLKRIIDKLINGSSRFLLKDADYGRREI